MFGVLWSINMAEGSTAATLAYFAIAFVIIATAATAAVYISRYYCLHLRLLHFYRLIPAIFLFIRSTNQTERAIQYRCRGNVLENILKCLSSNV